MTGETIVVVRDVATDQPTYGDPHTGQTQRHTIDGCSIFPRVSGAGPSTQGVFDRGRQGVIEGLTLIVPNGADIRSTDRVEWRGHTYSVEGEMGDWTSPLSGTAWGVEVSLRRAAG